MGSLERIQGYIDIEHEPEATESGQPPAAWPTSGDLRVENLSARYSQVWSSAKITTNEHLHNSSQTGPVILHNLSFHIESGQRIGVGTSSLHCSLIIDG